MRHAAQLQTSDRLKKVLDALQDRQWHSTLHIMMETSLCAVGSAISELRANGLIIECRCAGKGRYEYRLIERIDCGSGHDYGICPDCGQGHGVVIFKAEGR